MSPGSLWVSLPLVSELTKQRTAVIQSAVTKTGSKSGTGQTPDKDSRRVLSSAAATATGSVSALLSWLRADRHPGSSPTQPSSRRRQCSVTGCFVQWWVPAANQTTLHTSTISRRFGSTPVTAENDRHTHGSASPQPGEDRLDFRFCDTT